MGQKTVCFAKCILLIFTSAALIISIFASFLSNSEFGRQIGLFAKWNNTQSWSRRGFATNSTFTPIGWAFRAWIAIYVYQLVVVAHCWTTLCRYAPTGGLLCCDPDLAPAGLLFWHFIASLLNLAWIFLADRVDAFPYLLVPQVCVLFFLAASLFASLISSYYWLLVGKSALKQSAYWCVVIFVQNGVSLYAGWTVFASFLNLSITLTLFSGLPSESASLICLAVLNALAVSYVVMELTAFDGALRFIFTPHMAFIWASGTALGNNFDGWNLTNILLLLLICIVGTGMLLKVIAAIIRTQTSPIFPDFAGNIRWDAQYSLEKMFR